MIAATFTFLKSKADKVDRVLRNIFAPKTIFQFARNQEWLDKFVWDSRTIMTTCGLAKA